METILIVLALLMLAAAWVWHMVQRWFETAMHEEQAPLRDAITSDPNAGVFVMVCPVCDRAWSSEGKSIQGTHSSTLLIIEWGVEAKVCRQCKIYELAARGRSQGNVWQGNHSSDSHSLDSNPGRWV